MHKGLIFAGVGLIAVAIGAYVAFGRGGAAPSSEVNATSTPPATLRELANSSTPQKCTFESANNSKGVVYVASGKVRGDFSAEVAGSAMSGHLIVMDNTSYVWMDGMAQGFKNSFDAAATTSAQSQGLSPDERVSYSCQAWSPDQSLFTLPAGVEFRAISAAQVQMGAGAMGASCGQCDLIPDAGARAQCKAALQC